MEENKDYHAYRYGDHLTPGSELKIEHSVVCENVDISTLITMGIDSLEAMRQGSIDGEQKAYEIVVAAAKQWEQQAAATQTINRALEYLRTPEIEHTGNQWKDTDNWRADQKISNRVYQMTCSIWEDTKYDRETKQSVPIAWYVTWEVRIHSPKQGYGAKIAGQNQKRYTDKNAAIKYLDGRKKAYSHLFTEISPPIPKEYEHHFMVHGTLLPGYTVEGLEQAKTEHAAAEVSEGGIFTPENQEKPSVLGKLSVAKTQEKTPTTPGTAMKKKEDLKTYLKTISSRGNEKLAESISHTAEDVGNRYIKSFSFCSHEIGLLFGNVQSGKTGQMFGIMCKAADLGFPAFVLLTTDNVVLQQQTLDRVKADLTGFCVCGENDSGLFIENSLLQPAIVVLKKNYRVLKLWANVFASTGFMKGNPLFIIDDEADAASLNTLVNRNKQSSINKYLDAIKNGASSSIYLQVTGTPQAILLQTMASGWRPYFTYYFEPGEAYLGGDFFFPKNKTSDCIKFLETVKKPEHQVVIRHLAVSSQILASGGKVSNCLVHPSVRQAVHGKYAKAMTDELLWCKEHLENEFRDELLKEYDHLHPQRKERVTFDSLFNEAKELLNSGSVKVLVMNGKNEVDSSEYSSGSNIVIGGNTLGRGVTFPALHTIYYTRTSKKPQADTMWQHSRMFGYDRDPGMMEVFIDEPLYKLFADINATNNSIIAQIEQGAEKIRIFYPEGLNPTRANVLDKKKVFMLSGGTNYYPFDPDNTTIEQLDALLAPFDDAEPSYQVNLRLMKEIFSHISSAEDFNVSSFVSILDTMLAEQPSAQGVLIVRRNRDVAKGTGALLSPNDWSLGASFEDKVVLTMYKMTGRKGWNGRQLWVPNIRLPKDVVYYDVEEAEEEES